MRERIKKIPGLLRGFIFRIICIGKFKAGKRFILGRYTNIEVGKNAVVELGNRVLIRRFSSVCASSGNIQIGDKVFLNESVMIAAKKSIQIGDRTLIGPGVKIYDHDHIYDKNGVYNEYRTDEVIIGHDCWVGANAVILRGSKIGNHVVIGAGCVVKGEVPDNTVVVYELRNKHTALEK